MSSLVNWQHTCTVDRCHLPFTAEPTYWRFPTAQIHVIFFPFSSTCFHLDLCPIAPLDFSSANAPVDLHMQACKRMDGADVQYCFTNVPQSRHILVAKANLCD
jgi:hypothetical protein